MIINSRFPGSLILESEKMSKEEYCPYCEDYYEYDSKKETLTYTVKGQKVSIEAKVRRCSNCGKGLTSDKEDQKVLDLVYAEYNRKFKK